jgi:hypothetical protein
MLNKNYALIKDGFVVNTVVWDGQGEIFSDFSTVEITDSFQASIDDAYVNGVLYAKPRDGYDYTFSSAALTWTITAESAKRKSAAAAAGNLVTAQSEYDRASIKITALQQQIDDEDYSDIDTAATVAQTKATWTTYRKALRAYIAGGDGSVSLPATTAV